MWNIFESWMVVGAYMSYEIKIDKGNFIFLVFFLLVWIVTQRKVFALVETEHFEQVEQEEYDNHLKRDFSQIYRRWQSHYFQSWSTECWKMLIIKFLNKYLKLKQVFINPFHRPEKIIDPQFPGCKPDYMTAWNRNKENILIRFQEFPSYTNR